jgi:hypothetical protein
VTEREYLLFCDESDQRGRYYSNFYGGVIVGSSQYEAVTGRLARCKEDLHLYGEAKWQKVTERYLPKYQELARAFFHEVAEGHLRVRIMFRQNCHQPQSLSKQQREDEYYMLYYQFIKHAFGVRYMPPRAGGTRLRLYFDRFPDTGVKVQRFRSYLLGLQETPEFMHAGVMIAEEDITEVRSHDHVLVQCLDVVLGAMTFRLNDKHKERPPGATRRGARTLAKEKLYRSILQEIRRVYPSFNIGITTGVSGQRSRRWSDPYRHWSFIAAESVYDETLTKKRGHTKNPA